MKRFLVTGASRGIGRSVALELSRRGSVLALARTHSALEALKVEAGETLEPFPFALGSDDWGLLKSRIEQWGPLDGVVHAAATLLNKPFLELSDSEITQTFVQNSVAVFGLFRTLIPLSNPGAHFVALGSMGGMTGTAKFSGLSAYSSSKAAMMTLTECLQAEFADSGLSFNSLALGAVDTEMLNAAFPGYRAPVDADTMGAFIASFVESAHPVIRGKVVPVSRSTP